MGSMLKGDSMVREHLGWLRPEYVDVFKCIAKCIEYGWLPSLMIFSSWSDKLLSFAAGNCSFIHGLHKRTLIVNRCYALNTLKVRMWTGVIRWTPQTNHGCLLPRGLSYLLIPAPVYFHPSDSCPCILPIIQIPAPVYFHPSDSWRSNRSPSSPERLCRKDRRG